MEYTIKDKPNLLIRVMQDQDPQDPREWDNLGVMYCLHKRYKLGDKQNGYTECNSWREVANKLRVEEKAVILLPLYLYDHSGLRIKVGSFNGMLPQGHAEYDSGQIGYIYITEEKLKAENITEEEAIRRLTEEVKVYDHYLSGDVIAATLIEKVKCGCCGHIKEKIKDSISGLYGYTYEDAIREIAGHFGINKEDIQGVRGLQ